MEVIRTETDFDELKTRSIRNHGIFNQLKDYELGSLFKESVLYFPDELKEQLIKNGDIKEIRKNVNKKNYYNIFYEITGVNALIVEMKVRLDYFDIKNVYKIIPKIIDSKSGRTHNILDHIGDSVIRYGERISEYSKDGISHSVERLILGLRDCDADVYNEQPGKKVIHHDIQKAVLSAETLAIGTAADHKQYHRITGGCFSRRNSLLIRNKDEFSDFLNIIRIIFN